MKKTFPLHVPGKEDPRVLEALKLELTKYVKRERRKTLPPDVDFWDFKCKVGSNSETATELPLTDIPKAIEAASVAGASEVYVEILAGPGYRVKKPALAPYHRRES
jgi:hypothetical protein